MSKYYIVDTTIGTKPVIFEEIEQLISHLEGTVQRKFRQTRKQYMQNLIDLGHGYDDPQGIYFTELMMEKFDVGLRRKDGRHVRSNIHEHARNVKYRNEMGD